MPPRWLYRVDERGIALATNFAARLFADEKTAVRQLSNLDLTQLYRMRFARKGVELEARGLIWNDATTQAVVPLAHAGRKPRSWVPDYVAYSGPWDRGLRVFANPDAGQGVRVRVNKRNWTPYHHEQTSPTYATSRRQCV